MVHAHFNQGVVVEGISLAMEPWWGYLGSFLTFVIVGLTNQYSHSAVAQAYESADGKRIGFQMHNMFGNPGRKIEVSIGNARLVLNKATAYTETVDEATKTVVRSLVPKNKQIPVHAEGFRFNLLLDKNGDFYDNYRVFDVLATSKEQMLLKETAKDMRSEWREQATKKKNKGRREEPHQEQSSA